MRRRLTEDEKQMIRDEWEDELREDEWKKGDLRKYLADVWGVSPSTILNVVRKLSLEETRELKRIKEEKVVRQIKLGQTITKIARDNKIDRNTVYAIMKRNGIDEITYRKERARVAKRIGKRATAQAWSPLQDFKLF